MGSNTRLAIPLLLLIASVIYEASAQQNMRFYRSGAASGASASAGSAGGAAASSGGSFDNSYGFSEGGAAAGSAASAASGADGGGGGGGAAAAAASSAAGAGGGPGYVGHHGGGKGFKHHGKGGSGPNSVAIPSSKEPGWSDMMKHYATQCLTKVMMQTGDTGSKARCQKLSKTLWKANMDPGWWWELLLKHYGSVSKDHPDNNMLENMMLAMTEMGMASYMAAKSSDYGCMVDVATNQDYQSMMSKVIKFLGCDDVCMSNIMEYIALQFS